MLAFLLILTTKSAMLFGYVAFCFCWPKKLRGYKWSFLLAAEILTYWYYGVFENVEGALEYSLICSFFYLTLSVATVYFETTFDGIVNFEA